MDKFSNLIPDGSKNFVFIGEAGSGKSEVAINFAIDLAKHINKKIHFFDMDMTKPLFRSRDLEEELERNGIELHYEEQFMDAPTLVGGVRRLLKDPNSIVVMDVGGDYIGARSIGGFSTKINEDDTVVYYVLNSMRAWSNDIEHIDETLGMILNVSHIDLDKVKFIDNSNAGITTTSEEYLDAVKNIVEIISPYKPIEFSCVNEGIYNEVKDKLDVPLVKIHLYLKYEWLTD